MLYTLHSYISRELAKVFLIAALVLTVVLALGGLLQPLRNNGVSATQLFQLILYFFPMMLTFSLPVAALLAATLVYGRLAADNELIACRASGIGMATLILPGIALGVFVMISNLLLSNWFIPGCAKRATEIVKQDSQDMVFNKLRKDHQLIFNGMVVTADRVEKLPDGGIVLMQPSFTELPPPGTVNRTGKGERKDPPPDKITWCGFATIRFNRQDSTVTVLAEDVVAMRWAAGDTPARAKRLPLTGPIPALTRDSVSFKTYGELISLRSFPDPNFRIKKHLDKCRQDIARKMLAEEIYTDLTSSPRAHAMKYEHVPDEPDVLYDATIQADSVTWKRDGDPSAGLILGQAQGWKDLPIGAGGTRPRPGVVITLAARPDRPGQPGRRGVRYRAGKAELRIVTRKDELTPRVGVYFDTSFWKTEEPPSADPMSWQGVPGPPTESLSVVESDSEDLSALQPELDARNQKRLMNERLVSGSRLTARMESLSREQIESLLPPASSLRRDLNVKVEALRRDIVAELHSRGAFSVAGLVLVMLGAALGVIFRSGHVLVAFGLAAVPALLAITMVIMGNKIATTPGSSIQHLGLLLTWSGNIVAVGLNVLVYAKMLKR